MPMGLNISPSIIYKCNLRVLTKWETLWSNHGQFIAFHTFKESSYIKVRRLMKALLKNGLKISPKKCQLFKRELQYMGNVIYRRDRKVCVKLLRSRLEAIQKLKLPTTLKFAEVLQGWLLLSMFCPELQNYLSQYMI